MPSADTYTDDLSYDPDVMPGGADYDGPPRVTPDMDEYWNFKPERNND
jgi:hypothetical protein